MSKMRGLWQKRFFLTSPFSISTSPVPALPRSPRSSLGGGCRSFLSAGMDQRPDRKHSLNDQRCKSRCRYQSSARQLTRSSRPLVRHRPALTTLRRIINEPDRPPHPVSLMYEDGALPKKGPKEGCDSFLGAPTGLNGNWSVMKCPRCSSSRTPLSKFGYPGIYGASAFEM